MQQAQSMFALTSAYSLNRFERYQLVKLFIQIRAQKSSTL
ncbi:hypothetical protein HORM4_250019 [Vibrio harveyi]|nr:hypothetical protein HORM4_250019 [Vibrio harveyi]